MKVIGISNFYIFLSLCKINQNFVCKVRYIIQRILENIINIYTKIRKHIFKSRKVGNFDEMNIYEVRTFLYIFFAVKISADYIYKSKVH